MAQSQDEEIVLGSASPAPTDHKRKHDDLEPQAPDPHHITPTLSSANSVSDSDSEAKRQRFDDKPELVTTENGQQEKTDDPEEVGVQPPVENVTHVKDDRQHNTVEQVVNEEALKQVNDEGVAATLKNSEEAVEGEPLKQSEEIQPPSTDISQLEVASSEVKSMTRKMEVPNNKVGVLIGKAGDTIRYLQLNSGARIQITRDVDADPYAGTRPVELIGTLESIIKAEKLIKDVIAEADAGGSPSLVARGFNTVQAAGSGEQVQIQVPNDKVGVIIGKGGETIKNLQTRSGARIQLIPQHLPEGDQSQERTVRVTGDKKQIEMAREMIKEVTNQTTRPLPASSYNQQQTSRPRGPAHPHWGPRGPHPPYQSHNQQYLAQAYGNYSSPHLGPRSNSGWEQRPYGPQGGYDYYGGPGHAPDASKPIHTHTPSPLPAAGPPPSQPNYNYGQPQGAGYGQSAYSQMVPPASYGQGYNETKYDNQVHNPYGIHVAPQQPSAYPQGTTPGYGQQEQYGRPPSYGMPQQGPQVQAYGQPKATQSGYMPYQSPISSTASYGQVTPTQQPYPYASGGQMQPTYPTYSSAPSVDGYNQALPTGVASGCPQQGVQPVPGYGQPGLQQTSGYSQPGVQQASGYPQAGQTGAYVQYPSSQPGYTEQAVPIPNTAAAYGAYQGAGDPAYGSAPAASYGAQPVAAYGAYQGAGDPAYGSAPAASYGAQPVAQPTYTQPAANQPDYDQSVPQ